MRTFVWLFMVLIVVVGSGCEPTARDYFPLRAGNRWEYRVLNLKALEALKKGKEIKVLAVKESEEMKQASVARAEMIAPPEDKPRDKNASAEMVEVQDDDVKVRRVVLEMQEHRAEDDPLTWHANYNNVDQVWSKKDAYISSQGFHGRNALLILPPHTGYRWQVTRRSGDRLYCEVESHSDLQTPAGKFAKCAVSKQESRTGKEVYRYWFAPNVGMVRKSKYFLGEEVFRLELIEYSVRMSDYDTIKLREKSIDEAISGRRKQGRKNKE